MHLQSWEAQMQRPVSSTWRSLKLGPLEIHFCTHHSKATMSSSGITESLQSGKGSLGHFLHKCVEAGYDSCNSQNAASYHWRRGEPIWMWWKGGICEELNAQDGDPSQWNCPWNHRKQIDYQWRRAKIIQPTISRVEPSTIGWSSHT